MTVGRWLAAAAAVAALFTTIGIRVIVASDMSGPIINADEAGYLVNARAIGAGGPPSSTVYYPGYSAIISLGFVDEGAAPLTHYRWVLAINVALAVVGMSALVYLVRRVAPQLGWAVAGLVAAAVSALPSWMSYSPLAMSENALIPGGLLFAAFAATPLERRRPSVLFVGGMLSGILWSVHPRALAFPLALGAVGVVVLWRHRRRLSALLLGIGAGAAGTLALRSVVERGREVVSTGGAEAYSPAEIARRFVDEGSIESIVSTAAGQTAYLLAAGSVFLVAGLLGVRSAALRVWRAEHDAMDQLQVIAALTLAVTVGLSIFYWSGRPARADGVIYGRYSEPAALVVISIGLILVLAAAAGGRQRVLVSGAAVGGLALVLVPAAAVLTPDSIREGIAISVNIPAVLAYMPAASVSYGWILVVVLATALVLTVAAMAHPRLALGCMLVVSLVVSGGILLPDKSEASALRSDQRVVADTVRQHFSGEACVGYDRATYEGWFLFNYEFFLGGLRIEPFTSTEREPPCGGLVVTGRPDLEIDYPGAQVMMLENRALQRLWVLPGAQTGVEDLLFPSDPADDLPEAAMRAGIELSTETSDVPFDEATVELSHLGSGSPWANRAGLRDVVGSVGLGARWFTEDGQLAATVTVDLGQTMLPGDTTVLSVDALGVVDVAPGRYRVVVDVFQHGVGWFGDADSEPVVLTVDVAG